MDIQRRNQAAILILQANTGKTALYSALFHRYLSGVPLVTTLNNFAIAHSLRTAWLAVSMTAEPDYRSAGNLIIFTVLIYTLFHIKNPEGRFWPLISSDAKVISSISTPIITSQNAAAIVITDEEKKSRDRDKFSRKHLKNNYILEKNFRALDSNFLLYRNRYS